MPEDFLPYAPEIARALAHQAYVLYKQSGVLNLFGGSPNPCKLCIHPWREEIDYNLLIDSDARTLLEVTRRDKSDPYDGSVWRYKTRFMGHRDKHLMPLIKNGVTPSLARIEDMPFPHDGDRRDRGYWYLMRAFAIHAEAMKAEKWVVALSALKDMRETDQEMLNWQPMKPALQGPVAEPPPEAFSDRDSKLMQAFAKSRPKQIEEDVEETNGQNQT